MNATPDDEDPPALSDPSRGIGTYRVVRALCASPLLIPCFWAAASVAQSFSSRLSDLFAVAAFVTIMLSGPLLLAGVVIGVIAGARGRLADDVNRRMWRLMAVVAAVFVLAWLNAPRF